MDRPVPTPPGPGQESVWDHPRPPRVEPSGRHVVVRHRDRVVADSRRALRVLETSQAPAWYVPADDVDLDLVRPTTARSFCEWKGLATYADVVVPAAGGPVVAAGAAWTYPDPVEAYAELAGHWSFHPQHLDACLVDGERARPMDGLVYGGWVTSEVVGPVKGGPGTAHW